MACFLGFDAGTQSLKIVLIDALAGRIIAADSVNYGTELPAYNAPNGFLPQADPTLRHADPLLWVEALELALLKLQRAGAPMAAVAGISGAAQQHGSVYLAEPISPPRPGQPLADQLRPCLARPTAPIWMDHSTGAECRELQQRFGSRLQADTGSPAVERFTAAQIRRFWKTEPAAYAATRQIHLVSSFLTSLLIGGAAPCDLGDGAGMNLLNLHNGQWDPEITAFTAPDLLHKLPRCVAAPAIVGELTPYFARFGLRPGLPVALATGDNPAALIGVGAGEPGTAVISLGTSDTFFAAMRQFRTDPAGCGHVFGNPAGGWMSLICFSNGSLAREEIRRQTQTSWEFFDDTALQQTPPGNDGRLILPYFTSECTPPVAQPGPVCNFPLADTSPARQIRALLESQALSLRHHSAWQNETFTRIRVTGGASRSRGFRQILADVFQAGIESIAVTDAAALGAALNAAHAVAGIPFATLYADFAQTVENIEPQPSLASLYHERLAAFIDWEQQAAAARE